MIAELLTTALVAAALGRAGSVLFFNPVSFVADLGMNLFFGQRQRSQQQSATRRQAIGQARDLLIRGRQQVSGIEQQIDTKMSELLAQLGTANLLGTGGTAEALQGNIRAQGQQQIQQTRDVFTERAQTLLQAGGVGNRRIENLRLQPERVETPQEPQNTGGGSRFGSSQSRNRERRARSNRLFNR